MWVPSGSRSQSPLLNSARPLFGNGLFTNNGESWLHQRRLMQPTFHRKRLAHLGTVMTDATLAMLERWQGAGSHPLDIETEMTRLTLRIADLTLFNLDLSKENAARLAFETTLMGKLLP